MVQSPRALQSGLTGLAFLLSKLPPNEKEVVRPLSLQPRRPLEWEIFYEKLIITATANEEIGGFRGLGYLVDKGLTADMAMMCEPTSPQISHVSNDMLCVKRTGRLTSRTFPMNLSKWIK